MGGLGDLNYLIYLIPGLLWMPIISWLTGSSAYIQVNDDERKRQIKQKAIVQSWSMLILFFLTNFFIDLFHLGDKRLNNVPLVFPELLYLLVAIASYFIFYIINNRKMSAN
jgi:hypothetical protein